MFGEHSFFFTCQNEIKNLILSFGQKVVKKIYLVYNENVFKNRTIETELYS